MWTITTYFCMLCVCLSSGSGNYTRAINLITDYVHWHQNKPDAPMLIAGDVNHCLLDRSLPGTNIKASSTAGVEPEDSLIIT